MSQENVNIVRRGLEAWQRDDFDSWLATLDMTVEWHTGLERLVEGTESFYLARSRGYAAVLAGLSNRVGELRDRGAGDSRSSPWASRGARGSRCMHTEWAE
jgi:ketosteroid isomerase-like protein